VRWFGVTLHGGALRPAVPGGWHRVLATRAGACFARAAGLLATVTPRHGLFVADGVPVELHVADTVEVRMLYLRASRASASTALARAVVVTPLLRELIERNVERGALDDADARDRHLIDVVFDEAAALAEAPFALAFPSDPRALRAAEQSLASLAAPPPLAQLAALAGTSARTLERLFLVQTGCSVGRWQRRMRLLAAGRAIAGGASVTDAAYDAGYGSLSAFIAAFRRTFGTTPGRERAS
jgi:AraC-like DNA-binding protein